MLRINKFFIRKGTPCKVVLNIKDKPLSASIRLTTKDLHFSESITSEKVIIEMVKQYNRSKKPEFNWMLESLSQSAIFSDGTGGDRTQKYLLVVPYSSIRVL